jgi:RimJ/RimL family protein N-acetyltransferase
MTHTGTTAMGRFTVDSLEDEAVRRGLNEEPGPIVPPIGPNLPARPNRLWLDRPMFTPIRTDRLSIRPFRTDDAAALAERRDDPTVARYQNWERPYTLEQADAVVAELVQMDGPTDEEWWMAVVCLAETDEVLGDLAVHLSCKGRSAEVGYTFATRHWGQGYAVEATAALIDHLFADPKMTRVFGMLHPDNPASAMVLERCGMLFEGHTRSSFWVGDECSDDWIYGMTRSDWEAWRGRSRARPDRIGLVEVTVDNERIVSKLKTHKTQEEFVAPMGWSFTDALFPEIVDGAQLVPWMRAVVADAEIVGFVMLALVTEHHPEPYLWRLLIDRMHQRRGIGGQVLDLISEECQAMGASTLLTSWGEGKGSPRPFYLSHGFEPTGRIVDDETEARLQLS